MASATNLEEQFNKAVQTIQNLSPDGVLQPSNLTKLIFYGLYKQATLGPCQESRPSMFNYVARAKWEAWERCRTMTKEQAMREYIDEIRKIIEKMPQTNEVSAIAKSMGLSEETEDSQPKENDSVTNEEKLEHQTTNDTSPVITSDSTEILVAAGNDSVPSSSPTSSSSISSSDVDEFYDDPSDLLSYEIASDQNFQQQIINTTRLQHPSHTNGGPSGATIPVRHPTRGGHNHSNASSTRPPNPYNGVQYSTSSIASGGHNGRHPTNTYNKETQRAILTALTKLQRDIQNILERLNRLETSTYLLQQRQLSSSKELSSSKWLPLSGFRRGAIAFILLWPFFAYILVRLYLRARISIRFRR